MIVHVFKVFGFTVFSWEVIHYDLVEEESEASKIGGGSAHNFERDYDPLSPDDRYGWEWEDKKGFGFK